MLLEKLESLKMKWEDIREKLSDPEVTQDIKRFQQLSKDFSELEEVVEVYEDYKNILSNIESNKEILNTEKDEEFREMAKADLEEQEAKKEKMEEHIKYLLLPKDPQDSKNAILEIRAGTGGDEASIFAGDLFRMYSRYIEKKGWKMEVVNENEGSSGGYKEVVANISGDNVYGTMKYESGVHRVQRVPATESQGRVHTSAATVAVLPEADEVDVDINPADLEWDTFRSSGAGGQHVNKTESAVRVTHGPSGIVVECQESRSQLKNREKALTWLRSRLYEQAIEEHQASISSQRKSLVSTGDRSAKIRTYNFPQSRVTDHRINLTLYNLDDVMGGNLDEVIDALQLAENAEKMKESGLA